MQEDDDSSAYEPIEPAAPTIALQRPPAGQMAASAAAAQAAAGLAAAVALPDRLAVLAAHLSYHSMSDAAGWRELGLSRRLADCLTAARRHPQFTALQPGTAQPLVRLATDRLAAAAAAWREWRAPAAAANADGVTLALCVT